MRLATKATLILACTLQASAADVIRVSASCPGVDASTLDETVLFPIFLQINGLDGLKRIETEARNDGSGTLSIHFDAKTDLNLAEIRVQNRVNLALPALPDSCRQLGISVRKLPDSPSRFWLALVSTEASYDEVFLNNYAIINLKPACARVPGVTEARLIGGEDFDLQVWLNRDRMTAYKLTDRDVVDSLRQQNSKLTASGTISGKQSHHIFAAPSRLTKPEEFESVILRTDANGEVLRLRDVSRVEFGKPRGGFARVNGKPAALIEVTAWPGRVTADQFVSHEVVAASLPPGLSFISLTDRSADRLVSVEVRLPPGSTLERTEEVVAQSTELIRQLPGQLSIFAFAENREPNSATIFVKADAKKGPTAADVEKALGSIPDVMIRTSDALPGEAPFPVRMALTDRGESDPDQLDRVAERVLALLLKEKEISGPVAFPQSARQLSIEVNREMCAQRGVELNDIFTTLQTSLGGVHATEFSKFGRMYRVTVKTDPQFVRAPEDLATLMIRDKAGEMIPLKMVSTIRVVNAPATVVRVDGHRSLVITAAPTSGKSSAQVAAKCVKLAQDVLPPGYRVINLTAP